MQVGAEITVNYGGFDVQAEVLEVHADHAIVRGLTPSLLVTPFRVPLELPELSDEELEAFVNEEEKDEILLPHKHSSVSRAPMVTCPCGGQPLARDGVLGNHSPPVRARQERCCFLQRGQLGVPLLRAHRDP